MVKSGNYISEDYKLKTGLDVTDVKDKDGNVVLRYQAAANYNEFIYTDI